MSVPIKDEFSDLDLGFDAPKPLPGSDPRFPGMRFIKGLPGLKKGDVNGTDRIVTDDDLSFDIFAPTPEPKLLGEGKQVKLYPIEPFTDYTKRCAVFDLEWMGEDCGPAKGVGTDVIVAIGFEMDGIYDIACDNTKTEKQLLEWFFKVLEIRKPHTLSGHSIYGFFNRSTGQEVSVDLGMILDRSKVHGLKCPWSRKVGDFSRWKWQNAKENGESIETPAWECSKYELIDTHPQTALWDSIFSKLSGLGLKTAVEEMGLVKGKENLDIGSIVYKYWNEGDTETIKTYLKQDLVYTRLLWDKLMPAKYFQRAYMPMTLQRITTTGTGSWWNQYLKKVTGSKKEKGFKTASYQGALTYYYQGTWINAVKLDFSAMYPNIIEWLQLSPKSDKDGIFAKTVAFVKRHRKTIQAQYKLTLDSNLDGQQATAKVLANSGYGLFNTMGLQFNDPYAGARVTWAGRQLARFVVQMCVDSGCKVVGCDTDGVYVTNDHIGLEDRTEFYTALMDSINSVLPGNNSIDYEDDFDFIWIPPLNNKTSKKVNEQTQIDHDLKTSFIKNNPLSGRTVGLSKNYITITRLTEESDAVRKGKRKAGDLTIVRKGIFKKRNRSWLDKDFVEKFLTIQFESGIDKAIEYYETIKTEITNGSFPVENLRQTVTVASNWTTFPKWGFPVGTKATVHYVVDFDNTLTATGKPKKNLTFKAVGDLLIPYSPEYYLIKLEEIYKSLVIDS